MTFSSILLILLVLYFAPTIISIIRRDDALIEFGAVNLIIGWTIIGWLMLLSLALTFDDWQPAESSDH